MIMNSLRHGYSNLARSAGRDSLSQFWPFALAHVGALIAISFVPFAFIAMASPETHQAAVAGYFWTMVGGGIALIALFASAVCRRLHDTGRPGWLGLIPAVLFIASSIPMSRVFDRTALGSEPDTTYFIVVWLGTMAYNLMLIILIVLLCQRSQPAPNRYGQPPDQG